MLVSVTLGYITLRYILQNYGVELLTEIHLKIKEKKKICFSKPLRSIIEVVPLASTFRFRLTDQHVVTPLWCFLGTSITNTTTIQNTVKRKLRWIGCLLLRAQTPRLDNSLLYEMVALHQGERTQYARNWKSSTRKEKKKNFFCWILAKSRVSYP